MRDSFCDACGARQRNWHDDAEGVDLASCLECSEDLCSKCAGYWDVDGGYGDDGSQVRVFAYCGSCQAERDEAKQRRDARNDSGV